jgi:hypothetical protein
VFVNSHGVTSVNRRAPYGGIKQSGIGRKASLESLGVSANADDHHSWGGTREVVSGSINALGRPDMNVQ